MLMAVKIRARLTSDGNLKGFLATDAVVMAIEIGVGAALHSTPTSRSSAPLNSAGEEILGFAYPPSPTFSNVIFGWNPEWLILTLSLVAAALYAIGVWRVKHDEIKWSTFRTISFMVGIGLVIWTTSSGISMYSKVSFQYHMIQHMVLSMIAPIFIVLSNPITLALRALPAKKVAEHRNAREWILAALHSNYSRRSTHPLFVLGVFTFGLYAMYFTPLFAPSVSLKSKAKSNALYCSVVTISPKVLASLPSDFWIVRIPSSMVHPSFGKASFRALSQPAEETPSKRSFQPWDFSSGVNSFFTVLTTKTGFLKGSGRRFSV
jgi:hypothetical protein